MIELADVHPSIEPNSVERPRLRKELILGGAAVAAALVVMVVYDPYGPVTVGIIGIALLIAVWKIWFLTRRDPIWLAFVLMLVQLLDGLFFLTDQLRPIFTYGLTLLFCLPVIPVLSRAWRVRTSGFRLYLMFFLWCLITISYSISPEFSLVRLVRALLLFGGITFCSVAARRTGEIKPIIRAMMLASIVATLIAAAGLLLPHRLAWTMPGEDARVGAQEVAAETADFGDGVERFRSFYGGPNQVGELSLLTAGLILVYLQFADRKRRTLLGSVAILAIGLAAMADSRSDIVALAIGSTLYVCWRYKLKGVAAIALLAVVAGLGLKLMGKDVAPYIWRGDVTTLTGRTDVWQFAVKELAARPLTGYGWGTGGAILSSKYFPLWWGPWDQGPRSSLHSGYLTCMIELGIPAAVFWLFIILRPWVNVLRQNEDPWHLKRVFFFLVIPMLIVNLDETMINECAGSAGFSFMMVWALAEHYRLTVARDRLVAQREAQRNLPAAVAALVS
jgi:O-antigen ligase